MSVTHETPGCLTTGSMNTGILISFIASLVDGRRRRRAHEVGDDLDGLARAVVCEARIDEERWDVPEVYWYPLKGQAQPVRVFGQWHDELGACHESAIPATTPLRWTDERAAELRSLVADSPDLSIPDLTQRPRLADTLSIERPDELFAVAVRGDSNHSGRFSHLNSLHCDLDAAIEKANGLAGDGTPFVVRIPLRSTASSCDLEAGWAIDGSGGHGFGHVWIAQTTERQRAQELINQLEEALR